VNAEWTIIYEKLDQIVASGAKIVLSRLPIGAALFSPIPFSLSLLSLSLFFSLSLALLLLSLSLALLLLSLFFF